MSVAKKTYAEFTMPGLLFPETDAVEVKSRDIQNLEIPKYAYSLRFFDILITDVSNKGKKRVKAESDPVNYSPVYYIGTKIYVKREVAEETGKEKGLCKEALESRDVMMRQMTINGLEYALKCQVGGFIPLKKGNLVVLLNGKERKVVKIL